MILESIACTSPYQVVRLFRDTVSTLNNFRLEIEELDRAAQASQESQRRRASLEPRRNITLTAVRQLHARCHTPRRVARSYPPPRFAFYQGNF